MTAWTTGDLARALGATCEGASDRPISGVASLAGAGPADLAFCRGTRWARALAATRAGAVLVRDEVVPADTVALRCRDPRHSFARAARLLRPPVVPAPGVHPSAVIGEGAVLEPGVVLEPYAVVCGGARIGAGAWVQSFAYVGARARIGARTRLMPGVVVLEDCTIGEDVIVHPGAVIGADGFGHVPNEDGNERMPHLGTVVVEDGAEIGANSCVDRAVFDATVVGRAARLDNLVQIGHGAQVGAGSLLAAFVGLAGGAVLGPRVVMGGRSAVVDGVQVGAGATFAGLASASRPVPAGAVVGGWPARAHRQWLREQAALRRLPDLLREIARLEQRVAALEVGPAAGPGLEGGQP